MKKRYRYTSGEDENKNWTAALYVRLSVEDGDKGESNSVINQKQLLSDYISENNEYADKLLHVSNKAIVFDLFSPNSEEEVVSKENRGE